MFNPLKLNLAKNRHMAEVEAHAKEHDVDVTEWELEEIEHAFESGYKAGAAEGYAAAGRRETPPEELN